MLQFMINILIEIMYHKTLIDILLIHKSKSLLVSMWIYKVCMYLSMCLISKMVPQMAATVLGSSEFVLSLLVFPVFFSQTQSVWPGMNCWTFGRKHHKIFNRVSIIWTFAGHCSQWSKHYRMRKSFSGTLIKQISPANCQNTNSTSHVPPERVIYLITVTQQ